MSERPLPRTASITLAAISCLAAGIVPAQAAVTAAPGTRNPAKFVIALAARPISSAVFVPDLAVTLTSMKVFSAVRSNPQPKTT